MHALLLYAYVGTSDLRADRTALLALLIGGHLRSAALLARLLNRFRFLVSRQERFYIACSGILHYSEKLIHSLIICGWERCELEKWQALWLVSLMLPGIT